VRDELLLYYEKELEFLRQMGAEFAEKYPKIASRLLLEAGKCEDPHVERLLEGFAFLAARVHLKIDDDFPEITEGLLSILYPHYIRPIPSMSIVQMHLDWEKGGPAAPQKVPAGSTLNSRPVAGSPCVFSTCYDLDVLPINVSAAEFTSPDRLSPPLRTQDVAAIRVALQTPADLPISKLAPGSLRFFLSGASQVALTLYELLFSRTTQVMVRDLKSGSKVRPVVLPPTSLRPVGFAENEGMLPYPKRSFLGYRMLQEYFAFPDKYLFFELQGLETAWQQPFSSQVELLFLIAPYEMHERRQALELGVDAKTFRLNATPVINLFRVTAEPILLQQRKYEYPVAPDIRRPLATEVFSIEEVKSIGAQGQEILEFEPFYSYRHSARQERANTFWLAHRYPSNKKGDEGTEVTLSLVDLSGRPVHPDTDTLNVRVLSTNRDLPARLPFGNELGDFELEGGATIRRIVALSKPTDPQRPPMGKQAFWRLISHLSLNHLSLVSEGREALQEILKLYNFSSQSYIAKQIDGIVSLESQRNFTRLISENGITYARGMKVEIGFDEDQFAGSGVFLFASVLEAFLGLYATMNSFVQLTARTRQRNEVLKEWPPRAGQVILI
jgi:type VI secretion system protein ImpG